jgi:hypothetical protein
VVLKNLIKDFVLVIQFFSFEIIMMNVEIQNFHQYKNMKQNVRNSIRAIKYNDELLTDPSRIANALNSHY